MLLHDAEPIRIAALLVHRSSLRRLQIPAPPSIGQSREWAHSMEVPFFRFSPHLAASFELDNCKIDKIVNAMFDNEIYIRTQISQQIIDLSRLLKAMPRNEAPCEYAKITGCQESPIK